MDTLKLITLDEQEGTYSETALKRRLAELEGDAYTYLHPINLKELVYGGVINQDEMGKTIMLRNLILKAEDTIWTPSDFVNNNRWKEMRPSAKELLKKMTR